MLPNIHYLYKKIYTAAFLGCIAVLPMSDTIALRNILLGLMLLLIFLGLIFSSGIRQDFSQALKIIPAPLILWIIYLCIFPLWAPMPEIAWENLRGQWGESIVAWAVGLGAAVVLIESRLTLWKLGFASAFPLLVHLLLAAFSYTGFFSVDYLGNQNLTGLLSEIIRWINGEITVRSQYHPIENGFLGIETQPGNIGYASSMAIGIFAVQFFDAKRSTNIRFVIQASFMVVLCFLSILIARTRGGFIFGVLMVGLAGISFKVRNRSLGVANLMQTGSNAANSNIKTVLNVVLLLFICIS